MGDGLIDPDLAPHGLESSIGGCVEVAVNLIDVRVES